LPTYGSLFSGIGGIDLGLDRAGWTCKWQVEIDEKCRRVLEKHWPGVPRHGDIRSVGSHNLGPVDLVAGGFPCQPVSVAGKRQGADDARWLWPEFARVVGELGPRYVLVENVPGLLSQSDEFGQVLADLAELGFDAEWVSVPAAAVGAPHLRFRVFLVAHTPGDGRIEGGPGTGQDIRIPCGRGDSAGERFVADPNFQSLEVFELESARHELASSERSRDRRAWWNVEPDVGRVAHGVPDRVDRLKQLGNAVVPQVAQYVGERILAHHERTISAAQRPEPARPRVPGTTARNQDLHVL
jgi:DNA (cytosine-5)-methyltransferase 1